MRLRRDALSLALLTGAITLLGACAASAPAPTESGSTAAATPRAMVSVDCETNTGSRLSASCKRPKKPADSAAATNTAAEQPPTEAAK
jgi:hypothetical protein